MTPEQFKKWAEAINQAVRSWIGTLGLVSALMVSLGWGSCQRTDAQRVGTQFNELLEAVRAPLAESLNVKEPK